MIKLLIKLIKKNQQFLKYCVGGGAAFIVDFSLLYVLTEFLKVWYLYSATISFISAAIVNYLIQRYWTFKSTDRRIARQFFIFLAVQIVGLFINNSIMYGAVEYLGLYYLLAKVVAAGVVLIWNFGASKIFVFNEKSFGERNDVLIAANSCPADFNEEAIYLREIANYLRQLNYSVKIICYTFLVNSFKYKKKNFKQVELNKSFNAAHINSNLPVIVKYLLFFVKLFNYALWAKVIYAQDAVASGLPAWLVARLLRKRVVIKLSGDYAWEQAQLCRATRRSIDDWQRQPLFNSSSLWVNYKLRLVNFIQRVVARNVDTVIVPSYYLKNIIQRWGVVPNRIRVVYNAVDFKQNKKIDKARAQAMINISGDIILTGGRLMPWKGFLMFIEMMPSLKKINSNFKLVIFGAGYQFKQLQNLIKAHAWEKDIFLVGQLAADELYKYYSAACLFVLNSCYEPYTQNILKAMYYGLPVIVSNRGSNPELIQDDYNGYLVEQNDKQEWIQAIERLWRDKALRRRLTANPVAKLNVFSFQHMAKETTKILFTW